MAKLYSHDQIRQLKDRLDYLNEMSQPARRHGYSWKGAYYYTTTSAQGYVQAESAWREYDWLRDQTNRTIVQNLQDGLNGLSGGNIQVAGGVLSFKEMVKHHLHQQHPLQQHLDYNTRNAMDRFESEVEKMLQGHLDRLLKGHFLDTLRNVPSFGHGRQQFHDALYSFVDGQNQRLDQAVSSLAVGEAMNARLDMQALSLVLATRFAFYKWTMADSHLTGSHRQSWERLVQLEESIISKDLGDKGMHFAVLDVLPSFPVRNGEVRLPAYKSIKDAFRKKSIQFHPDKQHAPGMPQQGTSINRERARINTALAERMMRKVTAANGFLNNQHNRQGLNRQFPSFVETLVKEQKYSKLKLLLQELRDVDRRLASSMRIPVDQLEKRIQDPVDRLVDEVRRTKERVQAKWQSVCLRELNEELFKLKQISQELAAYPEIVPENLIKGISEIVTEEIERDGKKAHMCISACESRQEGMACILQFGGHLISLGRICHHLRDFKLKAEEQISDALTLCYDKKWGADFLLQLGMSLGKGKIGDPSKDDDTIAKYLLSSFSQLSDARVVMFNRETSLTQKDITQTLKAAQLLFNSEVSSWDVGADGKKKQKMIASRQLQEGWEEYDRIFDDYLKRWIASELTQDQLAQEVIATAGELRAQSGGRWTSDVKAKIPELLAGIFALYAILRSGKAYSSAFANLGADADGKSEAIDPEEPSDRRVEQCLSFDLLIKPHSIQILTLLSLTGYGNKRTHLENHVMQIRTGEGKSIALGGGAALLGLLGFRVRCVCYSKYLSQRDEKAFSNLFFELGLQNSGSERIVYSTITEYSSLAKDHPERAETKF
eukprot:Skav204076  [mRNA]  locus=scaffold3129:45846:49322:+ [translate_table: standard]